MSEFRQDRTNGRWAIIAPERGKRPHEPKSGAAASLRAPFDPDCPFCPGNEAMLTPVVDETQCDAPPGWRNRVVPNKYPILSDDGEPPPDPLSAGYGHHQVIIETPRHDADLPDLAPEDMQALVETWHRRFTAALALPGIRSVQLFRNRGKGAGASQGHSHSQIVAQPLMPPRLATALTWATEHFERQGECATCAELARETDDGTRVVEITDHFALLVPYAAGSPFEQWIVPRRHRPCFSQCDTRERAALAPLLQRAMRRLAAAAGGPACNVVLEPGILPAGSERELHWTMRIVPDLTTPGGFEKITGVSINPLSPEDCSTKLRNAV
jgi:UDPglucose--hexose-1-phosphate uridylyltransferase